MGIKVFLLDQNFNINNHKYTTIYNLPYIEKAKLLRNNVVYDNFNKMHQIEEGQLGDVVFSECIRSLEYQRTRLNHIRKEEYMWLGIVCFNNLSFSRPDGSYDYSYIIQNMIMNYAVPNEIIKIYIRNDNNKLKPFLHHESIWIGIQEIINKIGESFIIELR